ncbi:putative polysaccharide biosynthesis protein [Bacillus suaedae]|uniref:Polysaccharide biosynthesis protein n=1 Tax=Halalkalibacter suaedae TaxID=2822140 RepID=A0A940WVD4_9BACI|nr:polysaccharide biosynthesis protein [Bacillus suaedae]MBP3953479.1 polysaccharide biosynthesis protein [Bacillus suaedae]
MQEQQRILKGVALLSVAALVAKMLSAAYRIPYQNLAGDLGFYVYQQVYPIYGIVMVLAMYGLPVVFSKQRATLLSRGEEEEAKQLTSLFFYGYLVAALVLWIITYTQASGLAMVMGDPQLVEPIKAISFILFLFPFLSVSRGYQQSKGELYSTAMSHIAEQFIRVVLIIAITIYFVSQGFSAYQIGAGAAYGSIFGAVAGVIVMTMMTKGTWLKEAVFLKGFSLKKAAGTYVNISKQSLFICLSSLLLILFQMVDALTIVRLLEGYGLSSAEAYVTKGIYDRGQPLLQLGTVLTTTFTLALVPMVSKAVALGKRDEANQFQQLSYRLTLIVGGAASLGLMIIIEETNHMLFTNSIGADVLQVMAFVIILSSFFITLSAVLQGYDQIHLPVIAVVTGLVSKVVGHLLFIPIYGIMAAAYSTVFAFIIMISYLLFVARKKRVLYIGELNNFRAILLLLGVMGVVSLLWKNGILSLGIEQTRINDALVALSTVAIGAFVVIGCLMLFSIFSEDEWNAIPKMNKVRSRIKGWCKR